MRSRSLPTIRAGRPDSVPQAGAPQPGGGPAAGSRRPDARSFRHKQGRARNTPRLATRVLIVDDDEVFGKSLEARLRGDDRIEVVGRAVRGTDALRLTRELQPDIVLMDIAMPRMDGLTAARRLRKTCPTVRVVMLTGSDVAADENRAREVGARYIRKDALEDLANVLCA
jgi:CheY-like chemotaxis protein